MHVHGNGPNGEVNVTLTGRNVEDVYFLNAIAITDTANHPSGLINIGKYRSFKLFAQCSLNQPPTLTLRRSSFFKRWDGTAWKASSSAEEQITVSTDGTIHWLNSKWTWLGDSGIDTLRIDAICSVAPTSGTLSIWLEGVPN